MKRVQFYALIALLLTLFTAYADTTVPLEDEAEPALLNDIHSLHAAQANWTFSGMVTNESDERYNYFFQIQRNGTRFHGLATVIDGQSKAVLIYEESSTLISHPELTHWQVGNVFLRFNPINNSWVFGVKNKEKNGFNFKVDMLGLSEPPSKQQDLRTGVELLTSQTGRLNGHLQIDGSSKEQFVTAKKSWFRQLWVSRPQDSKHPVIAILCEFNDGSGFYSVTIPESDVLRGSVASWRNGEGMLLPMSQFVTVQEKNEGNWMIRVPSPKVNLSLQNLLDNVNTTNELVAGITGGAMPGFCAITRNEIEEPQIEIKTG